MNLAERNISFSPWTAAAALVFAALVFLICPGRALAQDCYVNETTGYHVVIDDDADLLTTDEESALVEDMKPVTEYGNVAFHSTGSHSGGYSEYAEDYLHYCFGTASSMVFVVDMEYRKLTVYCDGEIYKVVTSTRSETITDNVYRMASSGNYYGCAAEAYSEVVTLMRGDEIAKPMKYVSNALLAILLALLLNFLRIRSASKLRAAQVDAIVNSASVDMAYSPARAVYSHETRKYDPLPKGGSGGGGGGGRSGGGGGGHSGGGGSHGF